MLTRPTNDHNLSQHEATAGSPKGQQIVVPGHHYIYYDFNNRRSTVKPSSNHPPHVQLCLLDTTCWVVLVLPTALAIANNVTVTFDSSSFPVRVVSLKAKNLIIKFAQSSKYHHVPLKAFVYSGSAGTSASNPPPSTDTYGP